MTKTETEKTAADFGAEGGRARAKRLPAAKRSEIARQAAATRWMAQDGLPRAIHTGELHIGDAAIPCAVLEDGTRVLTQWGFLRAIGRSGRPAAGRGSDVEKMAPFLDLDNLKPFVSESLASSTMPVRFRLPSGIKAFGYRAELLPKVCEVYLQARDGDALLQSQAKFARACDILMRGLAHVGIIALVDEATGYQDARARDALAKILEAFVTKEIRKWVRTFPLEYYTELCRLRHLHFDKELKLPRYFGHLTNDLVYARLAPGVLAELRRKNPPVAPGRRRRHKHFQWLTEEVGDPRLREHLSSVITLMRGHDDWDQFYLMIERALPKRSRLPLLAAMESDEPMIDVASVPPPSERPLA